MPAVLVPRFNEYRRGRIARVLAPVGFIADAAVSDILIVGNHHTPRADVNAPRVRAFNRDKCRTVVVLELSARGNQKAVFPRIRAWVKRPRQCANASRNRPFGQVSHIDAPLIVCQEKPLVDAVIHDRRYFMREYVHSPGASFQSPRGMIQLHIDNLGKLVLRNPLDGSRRIQPARKVCADYRLLVLVLYAEPHQ